MDIDSMTVLTFFLVIITAVYAYLTWRIAKANEKTVQAVRSQSEIMADQVERSTRPYILIRPMQDHLSLFVLVIENTGQAAAENLTLKLDQEFYRHNSPEDPLSESTIFKEGIKSLPPKTVIQVFIGVHTLHTKDLPTQRHFSIQANYSMGQKHYSEWNVIDLNAIIESYQPRDAYLMALEKIANAVERSGLG